MKSKLLKISVFILILAFYGSLLLHQIKLPAADDLGRHIKNGELILQGDFDVLNKNLYSYTEPDSPFYNHHWLSGVIFYLLHEAVGFGGLVIFKVIIMLFAFALLFFVATKKANFWLVSAFSIPTILILIERTGLRPEIFSYLFIAIFLYLLTDLEEHPERKRIFWLIPLQLLWVNLHLFFVIGIMLAGGFLLEKIILNYKNVRDNSTIKKLVVLLVALVAVSFINPHGVSGALLSFPLNIKGDSPISIAEDTTISNFLKATYWWGDISVAVFIPMVFLLAASFIFGFKRKPIGFVRGKPIFYFLVSIATAVLAFLHIRGLALFGLFFLPAVSANFDSAFIKLKGWFKTKLSCVENAFGKILIFVLVAVLLFLIFFGSRLGIARFRNTGIGLVPRANDAALFFKEQGLKGPIFNDADVGSYLIYHLYPQEKVFVDNRFGDAYSPSFFNDIYLPMVRDEEVWREMQKRYQFDSIFFFQYDAVTGGRSFLSRRMNDPDWALVCADTYNLIFIKNTSDNQEKIKKFQITKENIAERLSYLIKSNEAIDQIAAGDIFYLIGREDLAMQTYLNVVSKWPDEDSVWMVMGEIELKTNSPQNTILGMMFLDKALSLGRKTAEVYSFLGLAYLRAEQLEKGEVFLKKALKINPERLDAKDMLRQLQNRLDSMR